MNEWVTALLFFLAGVHLVLSFVSAAQKLAGNAVASLVLFAGSLVLGVVRVAAN